MTMAAGHDDMVSRRRHRFNWPSSDSDALSPIEIYFRYYGRGQWTDAVMAYGYDETAARTLARTHVHATNIIM